METLIRQVIWGSNHKGLLLKQGANYWDGKTTINAKIRKRWLKKDPLETRRIENVPRWYIMDFTHF